MRLLCLPARLFALCCFVTSLLPLTHAAPVTSKGIETEFAAVRNSPPELYAFLLRMPKGGDLHNHLSGAVYAETFIQDAASDHLCIDEKAMAYTAPAPDANGHCAPGQMGASALPAGGDEESAMIDSLSMRDFVPGREAPQDHFFATFGRFSAVSHGHEGEYVAEVVRRAAEQNESYLELMALTAGGEISRLGTAVGLRQDFETTRQRLLAAGLEEHVKNLVPHVDAMEQRRRQLLGCEDKPETAPCRVQVRYVYQVLRNSPKEQVFAQILAGFMLAARDPRVVAVNMVQPEHGDNSMRDYHLHMTMMDFAKRQFPNVHVSLHAGELASGLVPPEGLRFHIQEAVNLAHAERIGHGVDMLYEDKAFETMRTMRERHIAVEINLTSNDLILGVKGANHPFPVYRKYGVPVTLSTDDEGVSRTHLTQEYQRAVETYGLSYADLKKDRPQ